MAVTLNPSTWINWPLVSEPLNWAIIGVIATLWLFVFHTVMTGFSAMQGGGTGQAIGGGGPGSIAAPQASTFTFATQGSTGSTNSADTATSWFGSDNIWTDGFESKYAEDGWSGNG